MKVRSYLDGLHVDRNLGSHFLGALFLRQAWPLLPYWMSYIGSIVCRVLRIDHTFKVANSVRMKVGGTSRKCYAAMLTGCNELGLVLMAVMTKTKSHADMEIPLRGIAARDPNKLPETIITDNPEGDKSILRKVFPECQLLGDLFHGMQYFGKSVKGYGKHACSIMKEVSTALWKTVAGPSSSKTKKRFPNSSEDFGTGVDLVLRHGLANGVKVNANKWMAAKTRMMSFFASCLHGRGAMLTSPVHIVREGMINPLFSTADRAKLDNICADNLRIKSHSFLRQHAAEYCAGRARQLQTAAAAPGPPIETRQVSPQEAASKSVPFADVTLFHQPSTVSGENGSIGEGTYVRVCVGDVCVCVHMYMHVSVRVYVCVCVYTCICVCACVSTRVLTTKLTLHLFPFFTFEYPTLVHDFISCNWRDRRTQPTEPQLGTQCVKQEAETT